MDDLAYCSSADGCRAVYASPGSWCPLAERTLARHAQGPLLFEPIAVDSRSASSQPPCADGEARGHVRLHVHDREDDFEGDVRTIELDGSLRELGGRFPLRADGSLLAEVCAPSVHGGSTIGFVVVDAGGHRSNPLCVGVAPHPDDER